MTSSYHPVIALADLPANSAKAAMVDGHDVLVCNAKGEIYAVQNLCTHQRAKLEGGRIRNCFISCPLHGVMFDLKTGAPKGQLTNVPLKTYETRVVDGQVEVCVG